MDILKCIPSVRLSDMPTIDLSEETDYSDPPANLHLKGAIG